MKFKNYIDVRDWLEQYIPQVYDKNQLGLSRIEHLLNELGNPEKKFKSIHVAGTSGKGTTAFYTARLLQFLAHAHPRGVQSRDLAHPGGERRKIAKIGLHTSPHVVDIRERMQIFNDPVSKSSNDTGSLMPIERFLKLFGEIRPVVEKIQKEKPQLTPSYFEILVACSFLYFAKEKVDWAVVEVGLGGRLDATNVLLPEVSVITNIGLDHTDILGKTVEKIAFEKAGIIKGNVSNVSKVPKVSNAEIEQLGVPVVTGASGKALRVIADVAKKRQAPLVTIDTRKAPIGMQDEPFWQAKMLAVEAVKVAVGMRLNLKLASALPRFNLIPLPGRLEQIDDGPTSPRGLRGARVILDGAHNPDKVKFLIQWIKKTTDYRLQTTAVDRRPWTVVLVLAFKKGKDWKKMVDLLLGVSGNKYHVSTIIATRYQAATDTGFGSAVAPEGICDYVTKVHSAECIMISNSQEAVFEALKQAELTPGVRKVESGHTPGVLQSLVLVTGSLYLVGEARTLWKLPSFDT